MRNYLLRTQVAMTKAIVLLLVIFPLFRSHAKQLDSCQMLWTTPVQLSFDTTGTGPASILSKGDSVFVLWGSQFPGNSSVWYSMSGDAGETWTGPILLIPPSSDNLWGGVQVDLPPVYVPT